MENECGYLYSEKVVSTTYFTFSGNKPVELSRINTYIVYLFRSKQVDHIGQLLNHFSKLPLSRDHISIFDLVYSDNILLKTCNENLENVMDTREAMTKALQLQIDRNNIFIIQAQYYGLNDFIPEKKEEINYLQTLINMTTSKIDRKSTERIN